MGVFLLHQLLTKHGKSGRSVSLRAFHRKVTEVIGKWINQQFHSICFLVWQKRLRSFCMTDFSEEVMTVLEHKIQKMDRLKSVDHLVTDTEKDFTRDRKLPFSTMIQVILSMAGKPVREELLDFFDDSENTATSSAFVQARGKILPKAFQFLFNQINKAYPCTRTYKGYRLIAVDGSDLAISYDPKDEETYHYNGTTMKGCNLYHINAAYDILNCRYIDMILCGINHEGEQKAMCTMAERFPEQNTIFIADRNYPTWNVMEHIIRSGRHFLFRSKDIHSTNNILTKFHLPDEEFDLDIRTTLTAKQTKDVKCHSEKYRTLSNASVFVFVDQNHPYYVVHYRVVRFKLDGSDGYESIITDLNRETFSAREMKELYHMRWGVETSFRHLKYSADLCAQHAKKRSSIQQEIWARLLFYNLSMIILHHHWEQTGKHRRKYSYLINRTRAIHLIRDTLRKRKGGHPPDLEALLAAELLPVRPGRRDIRKVKTQSFVCFNYRFS